MDALKKLKAEIERKKQEMSQQNDSKIGHLNFVRQKDVLDSQSKKRQEIFEELELSKRVKTDKELEPIVSNNSPHNGSSNKLSTNEFDKYEMSMEEITGKLRSFDAPVMLFAESEPERILRLKQLIAADEIDNIRHVDINDHSTTPEKQREDLNATKSNENEEEIDVDLKDHKRSNKPKWYLDKTIKYSKVEGYTHEKVIHHYFKSILKQWEVALDERSDNVKYSTKGKLETQSHARCREYLKPFFKMCQTQSVPPSILPNLYALVVCCEEHDFVGAHDWYIKTAIGNSAWPIGLTMVGIHERSSREKISKVAHVMNNEQQRKYLTSLKRLMSYAQTQLPDVAPSKKVLF